MWLADSRSLDHLKLELLRILTYVRSHVNRWLSHDEDFLCEKDISGREEDLIFCATSKDLFCDLWEWNNSLRYSIHYVNLYILFSKTQRWIYDNSKKRMTEVE